eukprot:320078_1
MTSFNTVFLIRKQSMSEEVYFLYIEKLGYAPKQARDLLRFSKSINKTLSWREAGELVKNPPINTSQIIKLLNTVQSTKPNTNTYNNTNKSTLNITQNSMETSKIIQIFQSKTYEQKCNGYNDCSSIKRIMAALSYYNQISSQKPQEF